MNDERPASSAKARPLAYRCGARRAQVINLAAERFGWDRRGKPENGLGCGFAFARYKNLAAYCAIAMES
jgi:nicotinate dehydrogenase subunit B